MSQSNPAPEEKPNSSRPTRKRRASANSTTRSSNSSNVTTPDLAAEARRRLGIRPEQMADVPCVTDRLLRGAGSTSSVINVLKGDDSVDAQTFVRTYLAIPEPDRFRLTLEEIFTAAGLTARRFVEVVTGAMMQQAQDVSRMMIAVAQPRVSAALVRAATEERPIFNRKGEEVGSMPPDLKAIEIFGKMSGMMPTPKGSQTIINMQQLNQGTESDSAVTESTVLEPMSDFLKELQPVVRPLLEAPRQRVEIPVNAAEIEYKFSEI